MHTMKIPGSHAPVAPRKTYRLAAIVAQAAASEAAVDLLRDLALGHQPERPLTARRAPAWASMMGAAHG